MECPTPLLSTVTASIDLWPYKSWAKATSRKKEGQNRGVEREREKSHERQGTRSTKMIRKHRERERSKRKRKRGQENKQRLYRGESKFWPATAPSSSSSSRPMLAATLVAPPSPLPPEQTDERAIQDIQKRRETEPGKSLVHQPTTPYAFTTIVSVLNGEDRTEN